MRSVSTLLGISADVKRVSSRWDHRGQVRRLRHRSGDICPEVPLHCEDAKQLVETPQHTDVQYATREAIKAMGKYSGVEDSAGKDSAGNVSSRSEERESGGRHRRRNITNDRSAVAPTAYDDEITIVGSPFRTKRRRLSIDLTNDDGPSLFLDMTGADSGDEGGRGLM